MTHYDYIVVGGGKAGALLANRLSADPQNSVLLVEAGSRDRYHWIHIPLATWELLDAFAVAAEQAGIPKSDDFNTGSNEGVGYFEVNQKSGFRWNTSKAFLNANVRSRRNLTLWTETQASKLVLTQEANGATVCRGLEVIRGGQRVSLKANKEVVLCAGVGSCPLL